MSTVADHLPQYSFDLENSGSQMALQASYNGNTEFGTQFSFTMRFQRETTGQLQYLVDHVAAAFATGIYITLRADDKIEANIGGSYLVGMIGTINWVYAVSTNTVADTNPHELLVVYDLANATAADRIQIYLDNARETASASNLPGTTITARHKNGRLRIGCDSNAANGFDGLLYNVAASSSGNLLALSDIRESDGTAKDLKDYTGLSFFLDADAGDINSDWTGDSWGTLNSPTLSTTLLDDTI